MPNEFIVKNGLISQGNITISGSITATGGVTVSGSIASASYASNAELLDGLDSTVFTLTSSFNAQTASFTAFTSSMNSFSASILTNVTALNAKTASFATTGSNTFVGAEVISGSLAISGSGTPFTLNTDTLEITGSLLVTGSTTLTGSLLQLGNFTTTGTIIAQTINVQTVTSSIVYSSGSNVFGNSLGNSQTFTGSVLITGSLTIAGASSATSYNGATIFGSTIACSPIGCFATSCATSFIGGTMSGTTIYGSTAVCSPVGKFTTCLDLGGALTGTSATFSSSVTAISSNFTTTSNAYTTQGTLSWNDVRGIIIRAKTASVYDFAVYSAAESAMIVNPTGTNNVTFPSGNIGIGTNAPYGQLDSYTLCSTLCNELLIRTEGGFNGSVYPALTFGTGGQGSNIRQAQIRAIGDNSYSAALTFWTQIPGTSNPMCERLRITSGGNVGIGTNAPPVGLSIQGTTSDSVSIQLKQNAAGGRDYRITSRDDGSLRINDDTAGSERMRITSCGNVGIGTTDPYTKLQVNSGNISVLSSCSIGTDGAVDVRRVGFGFKHPDNTVVSALINTSAAGTWGLNLHFNVRGGNAVMPTIPAITIVGADDAGNNGGRVGIGTCSPAYPLTLAASSANLAFYNTFSNAAIRNWAIAMNFVNLGDMSFMQSNAQNGDPIGAGTVRMHLNYNGNVGIGTTGPTELLHVCGNIRAGNTDAGVNYTSSPYIGIAGTGGQSPLFIAHASGYGLAYFGYDACGDRLIIATDNGAGNNKIDFSVNAGTTANANNVCGITPAMRITSCGIIQIGGTNAAPWNISSGTVSQITLNDSSNGFPFVVAKNSNILAIFNQVGTAGTMLEFKYNGSVNGSISTNGTNVTYATSSDYRLKTDLKNYNGICLINQIKTYDFAWKLNDARTYGVIAHELSDIIPYAVTGEKDALDERGCILPQAVDYSKIVTPLIKAVQEQQCTICSQASMINTLKTCLGIN